MRYRYFVVPFIGQTKGGVDPAKISGQLQGVIDRHAAEGWEFWTLNDVNIEVQPGCLAGLLGAKVAYIAYDQLISGERPNKQERRVDDEVVPQGWFPVAS